MRTTIGCITEASIEKISLSYIHLKH